MTARVDRHHTVDPELVCDLAGLQAQIVALRVRRSSCLGRPETDVAQYARLERLEKARLAARRAMFRTLVQSFD